MPAVPGRHGSTVTCWLIGGAERRSLPGRARNPMPAKIPGARMAGEPYGIRPGHGSRDVVRALGPSRPSRSLGTDWGHGMPTLSPGGARSSILALPRARAWRGRLTESVRVAETEISAVPARTGLTAIRGLAGAQDADLCPGGSGTRCWPPIPRTRTAGKPCGVRPSRGHRGVHAFGPDRFNRNVWTRRGPILARTGSEPGGGTINCTRTLGEPFGHPPESQIPRPPRPASV